MWGDSTRLYVSGMTENFGATMGDLFLIAVDPEVGSFLWSELWGGLGTSNGRSVWGDGTRLYTGGSTTSFGAGSTDFALVAWDVHFSVSHPSDFSYTAGTSGHNITWVVSCATSQIGSYVLYRDGLAFASRAWTTDQEIIVLVDNLALGVHLFTLVASDGYSGQVMDSIDVAVISPPPEPVTDETTPDNGIPGFPVTVLLMVAGFSTLILAKRARWVSHR
ncbi:MAG: hypothetical protein RBG13Loki_3121 [Promethearchaeota archaeon CR_4]|nr:MAG: hypothetical protein RBG13Loki_3121 [Candidatus Lokiarchaeota archaeon CR_4]